MTLLPTKEEMYNACSEYFRQLYKEMGGYVKANKIDLNTKVMRNNPKDDYIGSDSDPRYLEYIGNLELYSQNGIPADIIPRSEAAVHFEKYYLKKE